MLRVAALLGSDGRQGEQQILPPGWVAEMARPSRVSADTGLQLRRAKLDELDAFGATDGEGSAFWVVPARELVILDVAANGEQPQDEVATLVVRALLPH